MSIVPIRSAMPNPIRIVPEILLMREILCSVSRLRNFPAISTFRKSDAIFTASQMEKISIRSLNEYSLANAVAVPSQNKKTFGFNVFSKNPEEKILAICALLNFSMPVSLF